MDIDVRPAELRRAGVRLDGTADAVRDALTATYHGSAPDRTANPDWATTLAGDVAVTAAGDALAQLAGRGRTLAEALRDAADAYDRSDDRAAGRFPW